VGGFNFKVGETEAQKDKVVTYPDEYRWYGLKFSTHMHTYIDPFLSCCNMCLIFSVPHAMCTVTHCQHGINFSKNDSVYIGVSICLLFCVV
jgi:hypothetical protein